VDIASAIWTEHISRWESWLAANHAGQTQVWLAIYKKASGKQTVTFDELLETALCWGWIDVQTKGIDQERYGIRFVPRKPGSNWSATNRATVKRLIADDRMKPEGAALLPKDL
jgi:uncharacterized protein YdeI (YjbR/CyaY-like superfamily)